MATAPFAITYWPRRTGLRWWSQFDRGELREDMQRIASFGLDAVRLHLLWEDVQPGPRRINTDTLRLFERALDVAGETGLGVIATLFPAAVQGALVVPRWVANPDPLNDLRRLGTIPPEDYTPQPTVIYENAYRTSHARELFRDSAVIEAMRYQIDEVVGYFGSHPALRYWQLGEGLERVHTPAADDAVAAWFTTMVETARAAHQSAKLLGVTSTHGLMQRGGPRPDQLAQICDLAGVSLDAPLPLPEFRLHHPDAIEFLYALASGLAGTPLAALGLGLATSPNGRAERVADTRYGQPAMTALAGAAQQAEFLGHSLERLRGYGAPLVVLAEYSDYPSGLWRNPPLDQHVRARTIGLVDAAGREKADAVAALERWSAARPGSTSLQAVDAERYWHDPANECARLWRAWMMER